MHRIFWYYLFLNLINGYCTVGTNIINFSDLESWDDRMSPLICFHYNQPGIVDVVLDLFDMLNFLVLFIPWSDNWLLCYRCKHHQFLEFRIEWHLLCPTDNSGSISLRQILRLRNSEFWKLVIFVLKPAILIGGKHHWLNQMIVLFKVSHHLFIIARRDCHEYLHENHSFIFLPLCKFN